MITSLFVCVAASVSITIVGAAADSSLADGALFKQFNIAVDTIGHRRDVDDDDAAMLPIRVMSLDGHGHGAAPSSSDLLKHRAALLFQQGIESTQWQSLSAQPEQVHISFVSADTAVEIMWLTGTQTANCSSFVAVEGSGITSLPRKTTVAAATWTYNPVSVIPWQGLIHGAKIDGLVPGGEYTYRVGSSAAMSDPITFIFPDRRKDSITVALGGDMGTVQLMGWSVANQMEVYHNQRPLDVFWHLGDIAYSTLDPPKWNFEFFWDTYLRQEQPLISKVPMLVTYGNHDFSGGDSGAFINRFRNPGAGPEGNFYWSYTHGPVKYVSMCTEVMLNPIICNYTKGSVQYAWLEQQFRTVNRTETPWLVLAGHRPMYSSDRSTDSGPLQRDLEELLQLYAVDVELAGHMHETEVTSPVLFNKAHMAGVMRYPNNSFIYLNPQAPVHITVGTLGAIINEQWVDPAPAWSMFRQGTLFDDTYGFAVLSANRTALSFEFLLQASGTRLWDLTLVKGKALF